MKLELKHIAPYLPYGLKAMNTHGGFINNVLGLQTDLDVIHNHGKTPLKFMKPILRPLSDFQNKIDGISFGDLITHGYHNPFWQKEHFDIRHLMHHDFELLVSRHADVFGLINKGLAIDINTLKNEQ
jgi:hypothetical protein